MAKASKKTAKTIKFVTPVGEFRFPKITNPDTKGKYADGKFKTQMVYGEDDHAKMMAKLEAAAKELLGENAEGCTMPIKEFRAKDEETGERTGEVEEIGFTFKSKYRPAV